MEKFSKRRETWKDRDTKEMLEVIQEKHVKKLLNTKIKRNRKIFEEIARDLEQRGVKKTPEQIRGKFKALKSEYYKVKRFKNSSGAGRQTCEFFEVLDEIFSNCPADAEKNVDTSIIKDEPMEEDLTFDSDLDYYETSNDSNNCGASEDDQTLNVLDDIPSAANRVDNFSIKCEPEEEISAIQPNIIDFETSNESRPSKVLRPVKTSKKQTYEKVLEKFTKEWRQIQNNLLNAMEEQEKSYITNMEQLLKKNREETRKMMEEDRRETAEMFSCLLSSMQTSRQNNMTSVPYPDDNESSISLHNEYSDPLVWSLKSSPKE